MDDLFGIEGKRVLLTGGHSGIGRMLTEGLGRRGARIFTVARKAEGLQALRAELPDLDLQTAVADLADVAQVERAAELAGEHFGGELDVLINNAGATWGAPLDEYPMDGWNKVFDTNVRGLFRLTQRCLPLLRARGARDGDPARIVNVGSIAGLTALADNAWAYHPAKAAVHHLTKTLAQALVRDGITVNAIAPGFFPSKMTAFMMPGGDDRGIAQAIPMGRVGQAHDIVGTAVYLCSRASAFATGAIIKLDGGQAI